ncbi:unannotated protein [freshwater metagenome]|uniref:Unannotated protein n=1 Tax=freshwater metagenome TaxID=449393 RepID=A0A6J6WQV7_9ZZZZ|nr:succinylglutamate desuccinylase/aspartoacylase family protein [Actinomycetota bacterium]MSV63495.1 hypothetical protein [Actinomycetota bacterium]MSW26462.1 hypothetical protein [Actinomycetota bacterium]MSW34677.1 hypothetical protein [Actinomycetota bacterium]MSX31095.1 hypothetical protein [Actinomycetota bacterium]
MSSLMPSVETISGKKDGPTVAILGGVHGDEFEGVLATRKIADAVSTSLLCGRVKYAAPSNPPAWDSAMRVSPLDGLNLARVFPGKDDGLPTEKIAHHLTQNLIARSDLVIDLHSAGKLFDMPMLCGYQDAGGELGARSHKFAEIFAAPFLWQHNGKPAPGRSLSAAEELGIPSIYVEGRGGGQVRATELDCYVEGVLRILKSLTMINDAPIAKSASVVVEGDGNTDEGIVAHSAGYYITHGQVGEKIAQGTLLGEIVDSRGKVLEAIKSPQSGVIMLLRRKTEVEVSDTLAIVAQLR